MARFFRKLAAETEKKKVYDIKDAPKSLPPKQDAEQKSMDDRFKHLMEKED